MTAPINDLVWVRVRVDDQTFRERLPGARFHDKLLGISPALLPLPTEDNPGTLLGLQGFALPAPLQEAPVTWHWMVQTQLSVATRDHIRDIPGPLGWTNNDARNVYRRAARRLISDYGVPEDVVRTMWTDLFNAAKLELL